MTDTIEVFDQQKFYSEVIEPHIKEIKKECRIHRIPFFTSFAVANNEKETQYANNGIFTGSLDMKLADNLLEKYLLVTTGAELAPLTRNEQFEQMINDYIDTDEEE